jgi:HEPN domain-containing protein
MAQKQNSRSKSRKHTQAEYFELFGLKSHMSPVGLIVFAEKYLNAAKTTQSDPNGRGFDPARLFLAARSIELALKAFLSLKGLTLDQMAEGAFGHNLQRLLEEAKAKGLAGLVKLANLESEIIRASSGYSEKAYEYPSLLEAIKGYPSFADASRLIDAAETLIGALREPCMMA